MPSVSLLDRIRRARRDGPALVVIRHAERFAMAAAEMEAAYRTPLTDAGREAARVLGTQLPPDGTLVLHHSTVPRCAETAARIAEGFRGIGGAARDAGDLDALGAEYVRDAAVVLRTFASQGGRAFVHAWCSGELGEDIVQEPQAAGRHVLRTLLALRRDAPPDELHVHVTHDLTLIALLSLVRDVDSRRLPWPPFLDGIAFALRPDGVVWRHGARRIATDREGRLRG